jgi:diguanylate cyclase (GGDEF)-like protein
MREQGVQPDRLAELRTTIYRAYFRHCEDLSDPEVLNKYCSMSDLTYPTGDFVAACAGELRQWQDEWEGQQFRGRLPAMKSDNMQKPLLGFPTFDLLSAYFGGDEFPVVPESLSACEMKPRQIILVVGAIAESRCNMIELRVAYHVEVVTSIDAAKAWLKQQACTPDLILIDHLTTGADGLSFCSELRVNAVHRNTAVVVLLSDAGKALELASFDAGATDVMFNLGDPKVCQARLDLQLRMRRSSVLLAAMARLDYLTELPNRREFDRKIEDEWQRGRRTGDEVGLIVIDIDMFKLYNDKCGHSMGDDCLRLVAQAMARCINRPRDLLARYGGEEFVAVLPNTDILGTQALAERMCKAIRDLELPHPSSKVAPYVTISAGVCAMKPCDRTTPRALIDAADNALYMAKASGRNRVMQTEVADDGPFETTLASTGTFANRGGAIPKRVESYNPNILSQVKQG